MGVKLPAELTILLNDLGYLWPETDEEALHRLATAWLGFAGRLDGITGRADAVAAAVRRNNAGEAIDAFLNAWTGQEAPRTVVAGGVTGARVVGVCLVVCAALVLALKIVIFVQLVALAVRIRLAIATSAATSGGSLLTIPASRRLTAAMLNLSMNQASRVLVA
ncbi:WXG100-like domain-containing protein [Nonomuraea sp. NPDC002799]